MPETLVLTKEYWPRKCMSSRQDRITSKNDRAGKNKYDKKYVAKGILTLNKATWTCKIDKAKLAIKINKAESPFKRDQAK